MARRLQFFLAVVLVFAPGGVLLLPPVLVTSQSIPSPRGYGIAVAEIAAAPAAARFGFSWVKSFLRWDEVQVAEDRPYWWGNLKNIVGTAGENSLNLLIRIDGVPAWVRPDGASETGPVRLDRLNDWAVFLQSLAAVARSWRLENGWNIFIAYEIWNEPNLSWEWGDRPPDPAHYVAMLQVAYAAIKAGDPDAWVVSGGLATTGGSDDGLNVSDLAFIQEMYKAGARGHFDALGSHPYGFASPPEQDPATVEGLAFRRAEQQHAVMQAFDDGATPIWATGFSWLMNPNERGVTCHWPDRDWQKVSETQQADYVVRAFSYARHNWPWMGPLFLTGLDLAGLWYYDACEPMRWYAVADADADWHPRTPVKPYDETPRLAQEALIAFLNPPPHAHIMASEVPDVDAHPHYGINVSTPKGNHLAWASELGVGWVKVDSAAAYWPSKVLRRIPANWEDYDDLAAYCAEVKSYASSNIDAYEIGTRPNVDSGWSEGTSALQNPDPAKYGQVLETAFICIKDVHPDAIVVSGGLSTVGPYDNNDHPPSYPHAWNDLRFLQAMYDHGAKDFFDALGAHPYGFAYPPEQDPTTVDGLAFRRVEQQREVMVANGDGDKQIWATEWGWLLREETCHSEWEAQGYWWQTVDEEAQAEYIRRGFEYARNHWPWMGPMFLFNLDFSTPGRYNGCDIARYYAIRDGDNAPRQAYQTLRDTPKWPYAAVTPDAVGLFITNEEQGEYTRTVHVKSLGVEPLTYTVRAATPWLTVPSGVYTGSGIITLTVATTSFSAGTLYSAPVTVTTNGSPSHRYHSITVTVFLADGFFDGYLPLVVKGFDDP